MKFLGAFAVLCAGVWLAVWGWARTPSYAPLSDGEGAAVMRALRGGPALALDRPIAGPLVMSIYDRGVVVQRFAGDGETLARAVAQVRTQLGQAIVPERARIKVDVVMARAPILTRIAPLWALSLEPGVDGIGVEIGGRETLLLADDLLKDDLVASQSPVRGMEFTLGIDGPAVMRRLAQVSGATAAGWRTRRFFRFRAEQFIEPADPESRSATPVLRVTRGNVPGPSLTRENLRAAAVAGGQYLVRHLDVEGRFDYEYYTSSDQVVRGGYSYSLPRHAGAAWYLAQLYGVTHDPALADGARRARLAVGRDAARLL